MEVHDHIARVAAPIEQFVDRRKCLHRSLQRPDGEGRAAGEHERTERASGAPDRPHHHREEEPERREHGDPRTHDQVWMERGCLLGLLRGQAAVDEPSLMEPEVERGPVEGERPGEERPEGEVGEPP